MKILPVTAEVFHEDRRRDGRMDRRTDRHEEAISHVSQFCQRP